MCILQYWVLHCIADIKSAEDWTGKSHRDLVDIVIQKVPPRRF